MRRLYFWLQNHPQLQGFLWLFFCVSQFLSLITFHAERASHNFLGLAGFATAAVWLFTLGIASYALLAGIIWHAVRLIFSFPQQNTRFKISTLIVAAFSCAMLLTLVALKFPNVEATLSRILHLPTFRLGGVPCYHLYSSLFSQLFNITGTAFLAATTLFLSLGYFFEMPWRDWVERVKESLFSRKEEGEEPPRKSRPPKRSEPPVDLFCDIERDHPLTLEIIHPKKQPKLTLQKVARTHDLAMPPLDLLNPTKKGDQGARTQELKQKASLLEETLLSFGIEAKVGQVHCGPTIAAYEVHPAVGVKIGKITTLEHDIALNLEAKSIRIIAPIPGKPAVGIEVPHNNPQEVSFREILTAYIEQGAQFRIPMLLGKAVNGELVMSDLAKMPHCIIAGATGSGKSVCLNTIVMSILMTAKPEEIRLLMIDPKKVELTPYSQLPHMLAPVITEPHAACAALQWLVKEMEKRYEILKVTGQRNIEGFNRRTINEEAEKNAVVDIPATFPYYVAIVDELADLMMVASQDIETPIARIAQMARAVGIHLILATQRPSREVITGLIRANFPARIAFKVASRVNSQIILDDTGAESLLGNGDMLFLVPGSSQLLRAQGAFIRDEEINRVIEHLTKQAPPQYLISSFDGLPTNTLLGDDDAADDTLFSEAKSIVLTTGNASTTFLQRKLKIGYARAASLMDMLEQRGIVSAQDGARPRKVLFGKQDDDEDDFNEL